jgi:hypothetical protein
LSDQIEAKQSTQNQFIGLAMVVFGIVAIFAGCRFHYAELTTSAAGVTGAGINMLTNQIRNTLNNKQGGTINVADSAPTV